MNPLKSLVDRGQSVWLDYIRRSLLTSGKLQQMVEEDGLRGVTSNPTIFEKAITGSTDYKSALEALLATRDLGTKTIYERLAVEDIQQAAGILEQVYRDTQGRDGYVSLEVSPHLADNTEGTCAEARRLWKAAGRPNVMLKVPATEAGIPAITQLIADGINVNVTLIFSRIVYQKVAEAYIAGLEELVARGGDASRIASVASFFVSRIDSAVDTLIDEQLSRTRRIGQSTPLREILGQAAIANARLAYQQYQKIFSGPRWQKLEHLGARTQRLLWASTGTKNPNKSDVLYVEELIGPDTVNTLPAATYEAFRNHGRVRLSLLENVSGAENVMKSLEEQGISFQEITDRLLVDGLRLFADSFDKLLTAIEAARATAPTGLVVRQVTWLPKDLAREVDTVLEDWKKESKSQRLWARDSSLWSGSDEASWLGWLGISEDQTAHLGHLQAIADKVREARLSHVVLLGMGGSSLAPEVMKKTFGKIAGFPEFHVLDSTDPEQIRSLEQTVDLTKTLFLVSSKSGTTLETNLFKQYFFERVKQKIGAGEAGQRFVAITDPGSQLQETAERDGFYWIFFGRPSIGGRFSALSDFGMVPAAAMGIDVGRFLDRTQEMVEACSNCVPVKENPGVVLGTILGTLGRRGRDKVTLLASPGIASLGTWLEQLLAESTGKQGKGLVPVDAEEVAAPEAYGNDRFFVYTRLESAPDEAQDRAVERLQKAGHPVVRISLRDPYDLGQEFFRWEVATAVAGSILGINPFDQPDVEASKVATRKFTSQIETTGSLPPEKPIFADNGIALYTDEQNAKALAQAAGGRSTLAAYLKAHLNQLGAGDYFAMLCYLPMNLAHEKALGAIRHAVRDSKRVATCLEFGPRFLHSTGQMYKGGPNSGVFLQITCNDPKDLAVPGQKYTFGSVKAAQARGDFQVLAERKRRALRLHLGDDLAAGLKILTELIKQALL